MLEQMLLQRLMNQLQKKNPQMFNVVQQAQRYNSNPMDLFNQITKGYSKEQMDNMLSQARQFGIPESVINQVKNK